ncbi:hypothetical protein Tco_1174030 [Tanacetum coccineum]
MTASSPYVNDEGVSCYLICHCTTSIFALSTRPFACGCFTEAKCLADAQFLTPIFEWIVRNCFPLSDMISPGRPNRQTMLSHTNFFTWLPVMVATAFASIHLVEIIDGPTIKNFDFNRSFGKGRLWSISIIKWIMGAVMGGRQVLLRISWDGTVYLTIIAFPYQVPCIYMHCRPVVSVWITLATTGSWTGDCIAARPLIVFLYDIVRLKWSDEPKPWSKRILVLGFRVHWHTWLLSVVPLWPSFYPPEGFLLSGILVWVSSMYFPLLLLCREFPLRLWTFP